MSADSLLLLSCAVCLIIIEEYVTYKFQLSSFSVFLNLCNSVYIPQIVILNELKLIEDCFLVMFPVIPLSRCILYRFQLLGVSFLCCNSGDTKLPIKQKYLPDYTRFAWSWKLRLCSALLSCFRGMCSFHLQAGK